MNNESENKRIDLTQFEGMVEGPWTAGLSRNIHTFKETGVVRNEQWQLIGEGFTVNKPTLLAVAAVPDLIAELKKRYEEILGDLDESLNESVFYIKDEVLNPGRYKLTSEMASNKTGEIIARSGDGVQVTLHSSPFGRIFDTPIYEVTHIATKQKLYVSSGDIKI